MLTHAVTRLGCGGLAFIFVLTFATSEVAGYNFGSVPFDDVLSAAAQYANRCPSLTAHKLAALMLTPTWWEVTGGMVEGAAFPTTYTPSPMAMGRLDGRPDVTGLLPNLYYQANVDGPYRRAFWHPGIGAWQLDDAGMGAAMSYGRFDTYYSSLQVADVISTRYCKNNDLSYVFAPGSTWAACGRNGEYCQQTFNLLYEAKADSFNYLERDFAVGRYGGSDARTCRFEGDTETFTCYYVNYTKAQGHTGSWVFPIDGQPCEKDTRTPPLACPYYVFKQEREGVIYEWRYWLREDTAFDINIGRRRQYGLDSRDGLTEFHVGLCDVTHSRGACGAEAPVSLALSLNQSNFAGGDMLTLTLRSDPVTTTSGDLYLGIQLSDGSQYTYDGSTWSSWSAQSRPIRHSAIVSPAGDQLLSTPVPAALPPGGYTFLAVLARAQAAVTDATQWLSNVARAAFTARTCAYTLSATTASFPASGGSGSVGVTASSSGCSWTAASNSSWLTIVSGSSGTGNGTVSFTVAANLSSTARSGTLGIQGQNFTVNQDGVGNSTVSATVGTSPTGLQVTVDNVNHTAPQIFSWGAGSTHTIGISSPQYSGDNRTRYTFASWSDNEGQTHPVSPSSNTTYTASFLTQYLLDSSASGNGNISASPSGPWYNAGQSVQLTATPGSAAAFASWGGDCAGQPNPCTLTMNAPKSVTANFTPISCTFTLSPTSTALGANGGGGSVGVTASSSNCSWTATSNASWITISNGTSGTGNGTVSYSVGANTATASRSGGLSIGGQTFTITQAGTTAAQGNLRYRVTVNGTPLAMGTTVPVVFDYSNPLESGTLYTLVVGDIPNQPLGRYDVCYRSGSPPPKSGFVNIFANINGGGDPSTYCATVFLSAQNPTGTFTFNFTEIATTGLGTLQYRVTINGSQVAMGTTVSVAFDYSYPTESGTLYSLIIGDVPNQPLGRYDVCYRFGFNGPTPSARFVSVNGGLCATVFLSAQNPIGTFTFNFTQ